MIVFQYWYQNNRVKLAQYKNNIIQLGSKDGEWAEECSIYASTTAVCLGTK